jgi:Coenzyme PQQ synthesis protein D (PqqD)
MNHDRPSASVRMLPTSTGLVLLDTSSKCLWAYNDSARQIWERIEGGRSGDELTSDFARQYGISDEVARRDVGAIINQWRSKGLVSASGRRNPPAAPAMADVATDWTDASEPHWTETFTCTIRDKVFTLAIEPAEAASLIRFMFQHLETPGAQPDVRLEVREAGDGEGAVLVNGIERLRTADGGQIVGAVDQTILEYIHPEIDWLAMIHGGAIARGGAGVAVPGACGSGKTTLIAYLLAERGYTYIADDLVALAAPDGRIVPWPMPLNPKQGSWDLLSESYPDLPSSPKHCMSRGEVRQILPRPDAWDADPVPLRGFIFPRYVAGAAAKLSRLTSFEALERLLSDRIWLGYPITERRARNFVAWLDSKPAYALVHSNVAAAADLIGDIV